MYSVFDRNRHVCMCRVRLLVQRIVRKFSFIILMEYALSHMFNSNVVHMTQGNHVFLQDLPNKINETAHKALFYLTGISGSTAMYTFESSLYTGKFLGFKPVEDNPSLDKLVLLESKPDEVDEAICFRW